MFATTTLGFNKSPRSDRNSPMRNQMMNFVLNSTTFGNDDPLHSVAGKIGQGATHLDHMNKTFNLNTVGGKKTKMEMWDMMTILDA